MTGYPFTFAGTDFIAMGNGALFCPSQSALILADLHLGKSARMARCGGALLPPFETRDTLARLQAALKTTAAQQLFLLGDVFDDTSARDALTAEDNAHWQSLVSAASTTILSGNHDPGAQFETLFNGLTMRHIAAKGPDISGHYHPKILLKNIVRPAFLIGLTHLILPAFGTFTGGLNAADPVLADLVGPGIAVLTGTRAIAIPYGQRPATVSSLPS